MGLPLRSVTVDTCGISRFASELDIFDMAWVVWLTIAPAPVATGSSKAATSTPARTHSPNIFNSTPLRTPAPITKVSARSGHRPRDAVPRTPPPTDPSGQEEPPASAARKQSASFRFAVNQFVDITPGCAACVLPNN